MKNIKILLVLIALFFFNFALANESPLKPVRLDTPRSTMASYLEAMNDYVAGDKSRINDAVRTFDIEQPSTFLVQDKVQEQAVLLKEVLDRVIIIDFDKIPDDPELKRWRLKGTEITIYKKTSGPREGDFLFSSDTLSRVEDFYKKVKHLPYLSPDYQGAGYKEPWLKAYTPEWSQDKLLGIRKWQWLGLFIAIVAGLFLKVLAQIVVSILKSFTSKKADSLKHQLFISIEKPVGLLVASIFWFICLRPLHFEGILETTLEVVVQLIFSISLIWAAYRLTDVVSEMLTRVSSKTKNTLDDQLVPIITKSIRFFVVVIGVLVTIQNFGVNVMSLVAGLGLGGLAFALAAKDSAANFFGSIMILMDQPFKVGDLITTPNGEGTVEAVGFRSTRIRTLYDSVISIPNSILANENIDNLGARYYRRTKATLGIIYGTAPDKIEAFIAGIKKILDENDHVRKDNYQVVFESYGDFSLNILLYFFLRVPGWTEELNEKQKIFVQIYKLADDIGVEFAFPTQSLHIESVKQP